MRLLIVDDEFYTREGLKEEIAWKDMGITEILDAGDGEQAMEMLEWFQPDLVITDIRMPNMDGLEFAQKLKEKCPGSQLLFMSGYMEIEYFKKAIQLSAVDFIEKPLDMDEVVAAAQKALKEVRQTKKNANERERSMEALKERLVNYLKIRKIDLNLVLELCEQLKFPTDAIYNCVLILDEEKSDQMSRILCDINEYFVEKNLHAIAAVQPGYSYLIVLAGKNEKIISNVKMLEELQERLGGVQISVGFPVQHLGAVCESYKLAQEAMNLSFFRDSDKKIWEIKEIIPRSKMLNTGIYNQMRTTLMQHPEQLSATIAVVMEKIREEAGVEPDSVKSLVRLFALDMIKEYPYLEQFLKWYLRGITLSEYIEDCVSLKDLEQLLLEMAKGIKDTEIKEEVSPLIRSIYHYIAANMGRAELSLQDVSEYIGLSVTHISTLFRKETHMTVRQYIESCRIEQAKILLAQQKKIADVAKQCGFSQANYFVRVFRQETGQTPGEFRKNATTGKWE